MKILAVETSAVAASAAVCEDGFLCGEFFVNTRRMHSQTLMPMVGALLTSAGIAVGDIGLFAAAAGPGSFTGVRIGVSAVKGMAMAGNRPCVGVSSLEAMARGAALWDGVVCAVMDARRGQVYNALFDARGGRLTRRTPDRALSLDALRRELSLCEKSCILVGDGAELCYNVCGTLPNVRLAPSAGRFQRASGVAALALEHFLAVPEERRAEQFSAEKLLPVYLRPPQAERMRAQRQSGPVCSQGRPEIHPEVRHDSVGQ